MEEWGDYGEEDESTPAWKRPALWAAAVAVVLALVAIGYVVLKKDDKGSPSNGVTLDSPASSAGTGTASAVASSNSAASGAPTPSVSASTTTRPATTVAPTDSVPVASVTTSTTAPSSTTTTAAPAPTDASTTQPASANTPAPAQAPSYSTLPDGSPAPVIAVFNTDAITLTGAVPSEDAKSRLQALAIANSKFPVPVNNLLTIDPTVPIGIGVRVVELTSARFDPGSAVVKGPHGQELDRIVSVLNALPNVTALIIGHADQIGSAVSNYKLSADRAAAVVNYIVSKGIDPQRLSSRAVGDSDLITLNDDAASLASTGARRSCSTASSAREIACPTASTRW